jgi:hypothetical protein
MGRRWGLTDDKEDLGMLMLGVDTVLKLAIMKQTAQPLLTSLFVRACFSFGPASGARYVPLFRKVRTGLCCLLCKEYRRLFVY